MPRHLRIIGIEVGCQEEGMGLNRREFIQRTSGLLAALGIGETVLWQAVDRYSEALAEPAARKLALLVGINQYGGDFSLEGAVTDVELQLELLKYRFGFQSEDILTLRNEEATRINIESAFVDHLINQARPGDLVVFHFSGYGRRLNWETDDGNSSWKNSLVPVDGRLSGSRNQPVNDLLEETLWQLWAMLPTKRAICVLDTSYVYPGSNLQGNLIVRSRPSPTSSKLRPDAWAFQEKITNQNPENISSDRIPGLILRATDINQVATEAKWPGFTAGLFTSALTEQLWLTTPATSLQLSLQRVSCAVQKLAGVYEQRETVTSDSKKSFTELTSSSDRALIPVLPPADGAILSIEESSKSAQIWLGGLPATILANYSANSIVSVVSPTNSNAPCPRLKISSLDGLTAKAQVLDPAEATTDLAIGQLVQEAVRVLPRDIKLTVALDTELQRIERVDAISAFASMPDISTVLRGDQPADYLFGQVDKVVFPESSVPSLPIIPQGSYGLFSVGQNLLMNTLGKGGEAVKVAAKRLRRELEILRAAKLIRLTGNEGSSGLRVRVNLEKVTPEETLLMQASTRRVPMPRPVAEPPVYDSGMLSLPVGSRYRYSVSNYSDRPIYCFLFGIHNSGSAIAFYPFQDSDRSVLSPPRLQQNLIAPGSTLILPDDAVGSAWSINGDVGLAETQLICSSSPFIETFNALSPMMGSRGDGQTPIVLRNPFNIAQAVLQDLHNASQSNASTPGISDDFWALDVEHWATLSFLYRVV